MRSENSFIRCASVLVLVVGIYSVPVGAQLSSGTDRLESADRPERLEEERSIRRQYEETVARLIRVAGQAPKGKASSEAVLFERWGSPEHLAIALLGTLRATSAVPVLLADLSYEVRASYGGYGTASIPERFPAVRSLVSIGRPAVEPTLAKLTHARNDLELNLCRSVLVQIEGLDHAKTVIVAFSKRPLDTGQMENLARALADLEREEQQP